jgi:hypothetical protein
MKKLFFITLVILLSILVFDGYSNYKTTSLLVDNESQITQKYKQEIDKLELYYDKKIKGLISIAEKEYKSLPKEIQNKTSKMKIGFKYMDKISDIEDQCETEMEKLLVNMEKELNGLGSKEKTIKNKINEVKDYYKEKKEKRKQYYIKEANQ